MVAIQWDGLIGCAFSYGNLCSAPAQGGFWGFDATATSMPVSTVLDRAAIEYRTLLEPHFASVEVLGLFHARKLRAHDLALRGGWDRIHAALRMTRPFYERFVPATLNPSEAVALPRSSLDGRVETAFASARATYAVTGTTRVLADEWDRVPAPMALIAPQVEDAHPRVRLEAVRAWSRRGAATSCG